MNKKIRRPISISLVLLSSMIFGAGCSLIYPSPRKTIRKSNDFAPFDAIIVPGVPYADSSWSNVMKIRVHWANYLYEKGIARNVIFSGGAVYTEYVESKVMSYYGKALGIPEQHIFTEENAEHSTENVYYSYRLAKSLGFTNIALATDPFQTNNLRAFIRRHRIPVKLYPIDFDTLARLDRYEPEIDPAPAKKDTFVSLVERQTMLQRVRGTFGKYIIWHEEDLTKRRLKKKYRHRMIPAEK